MRPMDFESWTLDGVGRETGGGSERLTQNKDFGELQLLVNEQILDKSICRKGQSRVEQQAGTDSLRM